MKSIKFLSAFLSICLVASVATAGPVAITNGDLDDVPFGFSQGIPSGWSTTGASWFGNPGAAHTGTNAWYAAGNGFPGPTGGNLFQNVTAAVSAAFGGLTNGVQYTLTSCVYIKGNTGISFGITQGSPGAHGTVTTTSSTIPADTGNWELMVKVQTFTYSGGALYLDARWSGNIGTNLDTFSLSTGVQTHSAVPEPASFAMLGMGLLGLGFLGFRKVRK